MKVFLLDAMALIYRAHFSFAKAPRITSTGKDTSATYGFTNTIFEILEKQKPTHLVVAFESESPTFRHELAENYKAGRQEIPEGILTAIPDIQKLLASMNIACVSAEGFEADDVIGTLAVQAAAQGAQVYMMSIDKDYAQLVNENIFLYRPTPKGVEILDYDKVIEKFGVPPEKITDLFGLMGDKVDNIPGIPKIGEKTAPVLIQEYGSLESVLENASKVSAKAVRENLIQYAEQGRFSKLLATIRTDATVTFDTDAFAVKPPNTTEFITILDELQFKTVKERLVKTGYITTTNNLFETLSKVTAETNGSTQYKTIKDVAHTYICCDTHELQVDLFARLQAAATFCFDTETTGLDALTAEVVGFSFAIQAHEAYYVPVDTPETLQLFTPIFNDATKLMIGQNIKYDLQILANYGINVTCQLFDTMLAHYVCHSHQKHSMDALAKHYLEYDPIPISALIGEKGKKQLSMRHVALEQITDYAAEDADITLQLAERLKTELESTGVYPVFSQIEIPLIRVLADMERCGVRIDTDYLNNYAFELQKEMEQIEQQIYQLSGQHFNINSPRQLGEILFNKLQLNEKAKKTKTGQFATDEDTLEALAVQGHELPSKIIAYRQLAKLKSTYVDALPLLVNPHTGKLHTTFNQSIAVTGRLSSQNPNVQNIPIRTDLGKEVRRAFVATNTEYCIISADYSQIELRIMAAMSGDPAMLEAFQTGKDIHTATAAKVFGVTEQEVNSEMRRKAKTINFGIIYGITPFGLSQRLGIPRGHAKDIIDSYFAQYPTIKAFMDSSIQRAKETGYAYTLTGRRHFLDKINSGNATDRSFAERNAINTPIQGTAADMIKRAMIAIHPKLRPYKTRMILQVHDELLFDAPLDEVETVKPIIIEGMQHALDEYFPNPVPIEVNIGTGGNWLDAH